MFLPQDDARVINLRNGLANYRHKVFARPIQEVRTSSDIKQGTEVIKAASV
jgi:hypothetical protein